jgi:predicted MPP superfamily phosphohydrolase
MLIADAAVAFTQQYFRANPSWFPGFQILFFIAEEIRIRQDGDAAIAVSFEELLALRNPEAFPALLGHHPHAFDPAAAAQLPISLSGHTHGAS